MSANNNIALSASFRPMQAKDLEAIYQVQLAGFMPEMIESVEMFADILSHYNKASFVAEVEGTVIGYSMAHPADDDRSDYDTGSWDVRGDEECLYLHDLCVIPEFQGKGISKPLLDLVENFAIAQGFQKLIGISVQDTREFWKKQGFTILRPHSYSGEEGYFMEKILK